MRRTIELTNLEGAGSVGVVSCQLPMGLDYIAFYAVDENAAVAIGDISNIKHYMNSDLVRELTGGQQDLLNKMDKLNGFATDNVLPLHLDTLNMKTVQASYGTSMNTLSPDPETGSVITTSRLEITLGGSTAPKWRIFADVDDSTNGGPGFVERVKVYGSLSVGTSEKSFATTFPYGTPDVRFWRRIAVLNMSTGNITLARLLRGSSAAEVFKRTRAVMTRINADYALRAIPTGVNFVLDGTETGIPETWDTMQPNPVAGQGNAPKFTTCGAMDLRLTASAAATCDILLNTMGKF